MEKSRKRHAIIAGILLVLILAAAVLLVRVLAVKKELQSQLDAINAGQEHPEISSEEINIYLPETLYVASGTSLEIYNSQITDQSHNISKYNVCWNCEIGENLERRYSLTATEEMIGEYSLEVSVYDNALNLLAQKTCRLQVVDGTLPESYNVERICLWADHESAAKENIKSIVEKIESIRSSDSETPIYVASLWYQDGNDYAVHPLMEELENELEQYENVYEVPAQICVDLKYNFDSAEGKLNEAGNAQLEDLFISCIAGTIN